MIIPTIQNTGRSTAVQTLSLVGTTLIRMMLPGIALALASSSSGLLAPGLLAIEMSNVQAPKVEISSVSKTDTSFIRPAIACPSDINALTPLLLRDVPSYANRVSTRAQVSDRIYNPRGVVITASEAEFDHLELPFNSTPLSPDAIAAHNLTPFFFTTLERQYNHHPTQGNTETRLQQYHWAFLVRVEDHWELAMMFSRIGSYPAHQPVSPPRESRLGTIGQAMQLWLRDCHAGAVEGLPERDHKGPKTLRVLRNRLTLLLALM